ncbi:hypothetical protein [Methylovulum sp.]|uniref:hypothetical protein n=1 Tax=Methylovulum sp. TaxID=1916980 RepID=UPI00261E775A|nr:hypothetical protein [Methylovulum sp.]MDD5124327.1 hypothetical protein [Methylovulum sp.]
MAIKRIPNVTVRGLPARWPTAKPLTCENYKPCQPERRAVPLTGLLGIEDDAFCPAPEKPATPQCRTTQKTPTPPARQHPTEITPNPPKPFAMTGQKTQQASHKKRITVPQADDHKTKTHSGHLMVTASNPNPTGRK